MCVYVYVVIKAISGTLIWNVRVAFNAGFVCSAYLVLRLAAAWFLVHARLVV